MTFSIRRKRRREIATLVKHQHGRLPDTDDRVIYLEAVAENLDHGIDRVFALDDWCRRVGAKLPPDIVERIIREIGPRRRKADSLGKMLHLTERERAACRITTIGSIDCTKAHRIKRRKDCHRLRQRRRRQLAGATPRERSLSRTRPWERLGMSRRKWYRLGKPTVGTNSCAALFLSHAHESVPPVLAVRLQGAAAKRVTSATDTNISLGYTRGEAMGSMGVHESAPAERRHAVHEG
jgi:hypothetical protein